MHDNSKWSRRAFFARATGLAVTVFGAAAVNACTRISSDGGDLIDTLRSRGFVNVGIAGEVPYGYTDRSGRVTGEAPEVARAVFQKLGVPDVRAKQVSFDQLIPALNARQFDMVCAGMAITSPRCQNARFTIPDYTALEALLVPKGNPKDVRTLADVAAKRVKLAVESGSIEKSYAGAAGVRQTVTFESPQELVQAIITGRADAAILTDVTLKQLVCQNTGAPVEITPGFRPTINGQPATNAGGFVFRKDEPQLVEAFNNLLSILHDDGEWLKIVTPFGFTEENLPTKELTTQQLCGAT